MSGRTTASWTMLSSGRRERPKPLRSSSVRCRVRSVRMPPGCTEKARTPCSSPSLVKTEGEQGIGGLGLAVAFPSETTSEKRCPRDVSSTTRAPPALMRAVSWKCPRWLAENRLSFPRPSRARGHAMTPASWQRIEPIHGVLAEEGRRSAPPPPAGGPSAGSSSACGAAANGANCRPTDFSRLNRTKRRLTA